MGEIDTTKPAEPDSTQPRNLQDLRKLWQEEKRRRAKGASTTTDEKGGDHGEG